MFEINLLSLLYCLISGELVCSRRSHRHSGPYLFYWWKGEKVISSNVGGGTYIRINRMENTNRILSATTNMNARLVKCTVLKSSTKKKTVNIAKVSLAHRVLYIICK